MHHREFLDKSIQKTFGLVFWIVLLHEWTDGHVLLLCCESFFSSFYQLRVVFML